MEIITRLSKDVDSPCAHCGREKSDVVAMDMRVHVLSYYHERCVEQLNTLIYKQTTSKTEDWNGSEHICDQCRPGGRPGEILNDYTGDWVICPTVLQERLETAEKALKRATVGLAATVADLRTATFAAQSKHRDEQFDFLLAQVRHVIRLIEQFEKPLEVDADSK